METHHLETDRQVSRSKSWKTTTFTWQLVDFQLFNPETRWWVSRRWAYICTNSTVRAVCCLLLYGRKIYPHDFDFFLLTFFFLCLLFSFCLSLIFQALTERSLFVPPEMSSSSAESFYRMWPRWRRGCPPCQPRPCPTGRAILDWVHHVSAFD